MNSHEEITLEVFEWLGFVLKIGITVLFTFVVWYLKQLYEELKKKTGMKDFSDLKTLVDDHFKDLKERDFVIIDNFKSELCKFDLYVWKDEKNVILCFVKN